jgi:hypothetical protein
MMGMQTAPAQLFYDFCHVPEDHLLRRIDRFLDLEKVRTELTSLLCASNQFGRNWRAAKSDEWPR